MNDDDLTPEDFAERIRAESRLLSDDFEAQHAVPEGEHLQVRPRDFRPGDWLLGLSSNADNPDGDDVPIAMCVQSVTTADEPDTNHGEMALVSCAGIPNPWKLIADREYEIVRAS